MLIILDFSIENQMRYHTERFFLSKHTQQNHLLDSYSRCGILLLLYMFDYSDACGGLIGESELLYIIYNGAGCVRRYSLLTCLCYLDDSLEEPTTSRSFMRTLILVHDTMSLCTVLM